MEAFGLTVAEAMWKKAPVVASAVGGIQDQIEDGVSGMLVDPLDAPACCFGLRGLRRRVCAPGPVCIVASVCAALAPVRAASAPGPLRAADLFPAPDLRLVSGRLRRLGALRAVGRRVRAVGALRTSDIFPLASNRAACLK